MAAQNSPESVRVAVRVRPLNDREKALGSGSAGVDWDLKSSSITQLVMGRPVQANHFAFDHVFLPGADNTSVYKSLAAPVVGSIIDGLNGVIFAYGQTAAGKTHTMLGTAEDPGITRRAIMDLFVAVKATRGRGFLLRASYIEIYNEEIKDLLAGGGENLKIHEDVVNKRVYVNSREEIVTSVDDVMAILAHGEHTRAVGVTNMNERSSRSHTIFTLRVESREMRHSQSDVEETDDGEDEGVAVRASTLTLVDLAGSERAVHSGAEGMRLKEGGHINKSLLTLGTVINKLSSGITVAHIPYRDSKLTRILQPALGGNAKTAILCAVTPSLVHMDETLSTLRFASRAKRVTNHAHANEFLDDRAKLKRAMKEITLLKTQMNALKSAGITPGSHAAIDTAVHEQLHYQKRMEDFQAKFEQMIATPSDEARGTKRASEGQLERASKVARIELASSFYSRSMAPINVPDKWDTTQRLREALDLWGTSDPGGSSTTGEKVGSAETEKENSDLRFRALKAEKELSQARNEIEAERIAMNDECEQLFNIADIAEKDRQNAQAQWTNALSVLKQTQAASIVDEIIENSMNIADRDSKLKSANKQIERYQIVEKDFEHTKVKLVDTEKSLSDALKREKRGVGPVLKQKADLEKKLSDTENKLRGMKQDAQKLAQEKSSAERELKTQNAHINRLQAEVEKWRKKQISADEKLKKKFEEEKKKLGEEIGKLNAEKKNTESNLEKSKKEGAALTVTVDELTSEVSQLKLELENALSKSDALTSNLEGTTRELENSRTEAKHQTARAETAEKQVSELTQSWEELRTKFSKCEARAKAAEDEGVQLTLNVKELKSKLSTCEERALTAEKQGGELTAICEQLTSELEKSRSEAEKLEGELGTANKTIEDLRSLSKQLEERSELAEKQGAELTLNCSNLTSELAECKTELEKSLIVGGKIEAELEATTQKLNNSETKVSELTTSLSENKQTLQAAQQKFAEDMEAMESNASELQQMITAREKEISHLNEVNAEASKSFIEREEELQSKVSGQAAELVQVRTAFNQSKKENSDMVHRYEEKCEEGRRVEERAEAAEKEGDELTLKCNNLTSELAESRSVSKKLEGALTSATREVGVLTKRAEVAEKEGAELTLNCNTLTTELAECKSELEKSLIVGGKIEAAHEVTLQKLHTTEAKVDELLVSISDTKQLLQDEQKRFLDAKAEMESDVLELRGVIDSREKEISHLNEVNVEASKSFIEREQSLESKVSEQSNELVQLRTAFNHSKKQNAEMVSRYDELREEAGRSAERAETAEKESADLTLNCNKLTTELAECKTELEKSLAAGARIETELEMTLRKVHANQEEALQKLRASREEALQRLHASQAEAKHFSSALATSQQKLTASQEEVGILTSTLSEAQRKLHAADAEDVTLTNTLTLSQQKLETSEAEQGILRKKLAETEKALEDERGNLGKKLSTTEITLEEERGRFAHEKQELETDVAELHAVLEAKHEEMRKEVTRYTSEVAESRSMGEKLEGEVARLTHELARLGNSMEAMRVELKKKKSELSSGEKSMEAMKKELEKSKEELKAQTSKRSALAEISGNVDDTKRRLQEMVDDNNRRLQEMEKRNRKLLARNEGLLKETQLAATEKIKMLEARADLRERVAKLEDKLEQYGRGEGAIAQLQRRVRRGDRTIVRLKGELESVEALANKGGLTNEVDLLNRLAEAEGTVGGVREELDTVTSQLKREEKEKDEMKRDFNKLRKRMLEREAKWTKSMAARREVERQKIGQELEEK